MHPLVTLYALVLAAQPIQGTGHVSWKVLRHQSTTHRSRITRRYCEPATPDVNQSAIIAVACNQVETIDFTTCSNTLINAMNQSATTTCARYHSLYNGCLIANSGSETACSDPQLGYLMCSNYTMQAYAYCGCYYNDPANLTSCANGELQSKAASSQTLVPGSTLPTPASASSTVPPIPPISIYPVESANAITNAPPPPPGPPLSAGTRAVVSTISTTSLAIISGPAAVYLSTYPSVYVTTFYYCGDLPCPTSTSTFSTTITTTVDAPGVAAPSKVDAPNIEKSLITEDLTYTTSITESDFTTAGTGTSETVDTVYIDPAPIDPAHAAPDPAQPEVSERTTEARPSPAETAAAGNGAGGKGGVCLGKLRKRTSVLIVEG